MWVKTGKFWFTYTLQARAVQRTAHRTQTHKGPLAVLALSIDTGVWETLVHICWDQTKQFVGLRWQPWTCAEDAGTHPRRCPSLDWRCILWGTGRWSCPVCSCTDRSHTAACLSGTRPYLRSNTNTATCWRDAHFVFKEQVEERPPHQCSFCPTGPPHSLRCRCICTSSACSHICRSGRVRGRGRTRWYLWGPRRAC